MDLPFLQMVKGLKETKTLKVSILVLMDLPFLRKVMFLNTANLVGFQSLFLWIFRSYRHLDSEIITINVGSFNPCSYGSSVLTASVTASIPVTVVCFNPCSYGSSVLTKFPDIAPHFMDKGFQSLFLWIFRSYYDG